MYIIKPTLTMPILVLGIVVGVLGSAGLNIANALSRTINPENHKCYYITKFYENLKNQMKNIHSIATNTITGVFAIVPALSSIVLGFVLGSILELGSDIVEEGKSYFTTSFNSSREILNANTDPNVYHEKNTQEEQLPEEIKP